MFVKRTSALMLACAVACLLLAGCGKGNDGEAAESVGASPDVAAEATAEQTNAAAETEAVPSDDGGPDCGEELLEQLPASIPFPSDAKFTSVCKEANEYGTGIAVSYQADGDAAALAKQYRDALEGEYEVSQFDVPDIVSMQFMKGEEAITLEIDSSRGAALYVNLAYGTYEGGFDGALEDVLGEIVGEGE